jgi:hypothetical protein
MKDTLQELYAWANGQIPYCANAQLLKTQAESSLPEYMLSIGYYYAWAIAHLRSWAIGNFGFCAVTPLLFLAFARLGCYPIAILGNR